jgi:hypothetical protein
MNKRYPKSRHFSVISRKIDLLCPVSRASQRPKIRGRSRCADVDGIFGPEFFSTSI